MCRDRTKRLIPLEESWSTRPDSNRRQPRWQSGSGPERIVRTPERPPRVTAHGRKWVAVATPWLPSRGGSRHTFAAPASRNQPLDELAR